MSWITEKCYAASTACAIAEVPPSTLRAWRNNNGLLADPSHKGWNRFSLRDLCAIRLVAALTKRGLPAGDACQTVPYIAITMQELLEGSADASRFMWVTDAQVIYADREMTVGEYVDILDENVEVSIFIDLMTIIKHVVKALNTLNPERFSSSEEIEADMKRVFAAVLRPRDDEAESDS